MKRLKCLWFSMLFVITSILSGPACCQNPYGTTGLLRMPTAEFQKDGTFMFGNTYLPRHGTNPRRDSYDTFNYFLNVTLFPWMEVAYTLTMNKGVQSSYWPEQTWGKFVNQDRSFHVKFRLWEESAWRTWTPQIAIGSNDPVTHSGYGGGSITLGDESEAGTNNYLTRWYIVASKHLDLNNYGIVGIHASWIVGTGKLDEHYSRPAFGLQYRFNVLENNSFFNKILNGLSFMAEYDARTVNVGCWYDFPWTISKSSGSDLISFHSYFEMNQCRYLTGGILFKVGLF